MQCGHSSAQPYKGWTQAVLCLCNVAIERSLINHNVNVPGQAAILVQETSHVIVCEPDQNLKGCLNPINRFSSSGQKDHPAIARVVQASDEFRPPVERILPQVCARDAPSQVSGKIQPRCDVNVRAKAQG
jgi:hypothetical protein